MSEIRGKMSNKLAESMKSKRSGGVSFKSKGPSEAVETPVPDYKKELEELKKDNELKAAKMNELILKLSQKLKKVQEWKPLISKDTKKLKKWMNKVLEKENQEDQDLINSIMRSSSEGSRNDNLENFRTNT